jgi:hypothetical protein
MATTKPLWHYDPSSKNEAGTAPNGFKIYRATVVDSLRINFSRGEGEIIEVLAGKGPVVGDFIEAALPRVTGKQAEPPRTEAASRDDRSPLVLFVSTFFDALRAPRPLAPTRKW